MSFAQSAPERWSSALPESPQRWTLPSGFVSHEETIYTAVKHELREEVRDSKEVSDFLKRIIERILTDRISLLPFDATFVAELDRKPDQYAIYLGSSPHTSDPE